jgi:hypothetical protein
MVSAIISDTKHVMSLGSIVILATAHAFVGGGYLSPHDVLFRVLGIGLYGRGPDEFLVALDRDHFVSEFTSLFSVISDIMSTKIFRQGYSEGDLGPSVMITVIFFTCTYLVYVVLMNFLIAAMGDTFERVSERREEYAQKNRAHLLLEAKASIPGYVCRHFLHDDNSRFLFVCEMVNEAVRWSGFSSGIKRKILKSELKTQKRLEEVENKLERKLEEVENKLEKKLEDLDTRFDKLEALDTKFDQLMQLLNTQHQAQRDEQPKLLEAQLVPSRTPVEPYQLENHF